jgi:hypothetical protein
MASRIWSIFRRRSRAAQGGGRRVRLAVEQLDERIVPVATPTFWQPAGLNQLWSNANNWTAGLPDNTMVASFDDRTILACTFDSAVLAANRTVAGLHIYGSFGPALTMSAGNALTISSLAGDTTTGFKMAGASISQSGVSDIIIITGGGTAAYNEWSGGGITNVMAQRNLYINGSSTLWITDAASGLGDNITVGQDGNGGSTLEFNNQTSTLTVVNNAGILISDTTDDGATAPNKLLFDGDVTGVGKVTKGLSTTSSDSFIDNYGTVVRSNAGSFNTGLPIRNETSASGWPASLDIQSDLTVSGSSTSKTASVAVSQVGGNTILENGSTLTVFGFKMTAGKLLTYGAANATIAAVSGLLLPLVTVTGGTIQFSADNTALYGSLTVQGDMSWTGGIFEAYINGGTAGQQTQLKMGSGATLDLGTGAHLHINVNGALTSAFTWVPVNGATTGVLTFDSGTLFIISNPNPGTQISVTSR